MEQIHAFEKEKSISFSDRKSLIQFVSEYLVLQYKEDLEFWRSTAMDDPKEMQQWDKRIKTASKKLKKTLKMILNVVLTFKKTVKISNESRILEAAFKLARIKISPSSAFCVNVEYEIDNLVFKKDIKSC